MHLVEIVLEDHGRLPGDRMLERRGGHVRVAVAVAADPTAHLEERRQAGGQAVTRQVAAIGEHRFDIGIERGDFVQERRPVIRQRVLDFVGDRQARVAQHARLPQRRDARAQERLVVRPLARGERLVALGEQARDVVLRVENALSLHFGRVRGEHGHDEGVVEEMLERPGLDGARLREPRERVGDGARLRCGAGERVDPAAAVVMAVFGDVR